MLTLNFQYYCEFDVHYCEQTSGTQTPKYIDSRISRNCPVLRNLLYHLISHHWDWDCDWIDWLDQLDHRFNHLLDQLDHYLDHRLESLDNN